MRSLYEQGMPGAQRVLYVAEKLIKKFFPRLTKHLNRQNCHISMYSTQWFLTIFSNSFPFDLVVQVWDSFLNEGWKVVYRVMLTFMRYSAPYLFRSEFEQIMYFFKRLPDAVDGPLIMDKAFKIPLRKRHIEHYNQKFDRLNPEIRSKPMKNKSEGEAKVEKVESRLVSVSTTQSTKEGGDEDMPSWHARVQEARGRGGNGVGGGL